MNIVLKEILQTNAVIDGGLSKVPLHSNMSHEEGVLIDQVYRTIKPHASLEIGFAYGVSTLFVCDALSANGEAAKHIVIDPYQHAQWGGIGIKNIARAGYQHFIEFREERSEIALPALMAGGTRVQAAIIDGNHTFDHVLMDFFYVNKMLEVGGVVIFDDTNFPSISRVVKHVLTYPAYELFAATVPPQIDTARTKLRRALAKWTRLPRLSRPWDYPSCMAFRKIAEDDRAWNWHVNF